jgi:hypothetical protein
MLLAVKLQDSIKKDNYPERHEECYCHFEVIWFQFQLISGLKMLAWLDSKQRRTLKK